MDVIFGHCIKGGGAFDICRIGTKLNVNMLLPQ